MATMLSPNNRLDSLESPSKPSTQSSSPQFDLEKPVTTITPRGTVLAVFFMLSSICTAYTMRYAQLVPTIDASGAISTLKPSDTIWLYFGTTFGSSIVYFFQSKSIFSDLTPRQLACIVVRGTITFWAVEMSRFTLSILGMTIRSVLSSGSLITSCLIDYFFFGKRWYAVDAVSVCMVLIAIVLTVWSQNKPSSQSAEVSSSQSAEVSSMFLLAVCFRFISILLGAVKGSMVEYFCKIDYKRDMIAHFGPDHLIEDRMSPVFFQGASGLIGAILNVVFAVVFSYLPGNTVMMASNGRMTYGMDTITKVWNSWWLIVIICFDLVLSNIFRQLRIRTAIEVSAVAVMLVGRASTFPKFLLNTLLFTKPGTGLYLENFDWTQSNEWLLVMAMLYSFMSVSLYYEVGIVKRWKRD